MSFFKELMNLKNNTNKETMDNLRTKERDYSLQKKVYDQLIPYMEAQYALCQEEYQFGKWLRDWKNDENGSYRFLYEHLTKQDFIDAQNSDDEVLDQLKEDVDFYAFMEKTQIPSEVHTWDETAQKGYVLLTEELLEYIRQALR
ncbi:hypothetical protein LRR81_17195 [Metabacillus sp. GX 13764]|uniref:hypothetical protein n=1 Tax=Metabacillus kandeliae TaxID=2900151 RepID=UPI001E2DE280|nr:hypothetical protein [Metabacillus kandeliae]MCD7035982.1 hypothetical protein [Metabacillus kandeliae]